MDWKEQQHAGPPPQYPNPSASPRPLTEVAPAPSVPEYYANSPLQGPNVRPEQRMPNEAYLPGANPVITGQAPVPAMAAPPAMQGPAVGMPPLARPTAAITTAAVDDDDTATVDDVEWVGRAKRAIAGSRGDPHRQVQLMQHLRAEYLKQRFGRTIHTDEA